jgi:hypothetical protein
MTNVGGEDSLMTHPDREALADKLDAAFAKVSLFPDGRLDGVMDLLALRNLVPEAVAALRADLSRASSEPVAWEDIAPLICCGGQCDANNVGPENGMSPQRYCDRYGCESKGVYENAERVAKWFNKRFGLAAPSPRETAGETKP